MMCKGDRKVGIYQRFHVNTFLFQILFPANDSSQSCAAAAHGGYAPEKWFSIPNSLLIPCQGVTLSPLSTSTYFSKLFSLA
jgi:hypothetical protein